MLAVEEDTVVEAAMEVVAMEDKIQMPHNNQHACNNVVLMDKIQ